MQNSPRHPLFSYRHRRAIILSLFCAALLYLIGVLVVGTAAAWQAFTRLGPGGWFLLLASSFCSYLLRFARWQYYLRLAGWRLPPGLHLAYYLSGFALTTTPGKAGETVRSVLLRPHGIPYPTSLACFFSERLLDVVIVALLASFAMAASTEQHGFIIVVFAITLAVIPFVHSPILLKLLQAIYARFESERIKNLLDHLIRLLQDARVFLALRPLYIGLVLGLAAWSLQGVAFYYLIQVIGFDASLPLAMGVYAISLLAGALSMIPGGIGATEAAMALLLAAAGAGPQIAVVIPLISRLSTLWFAVGLGLMASLWLGSHQRPPEEI